MDGSGKGLEDDDESEGKEFDMSTRLSNLKRGRCRGEQRSCEEVRLRQDVDAHLDILSGKSGGGAVDNLLPRVD